MISSLLHLVGLRPRVYYTLTNFRGGGPRPPWPPPQYANAGASPGFDRGGGQEIFFSDMEICMSRSDMLRMAKPCALLGGFGGIDPREKFLKWCNLVRFGVYFGHILSLKIFKNYHFLYKKFKNCNFLHKRINILDTRLLWSNYSREEIF